MTSRRRPGLWQRLVSPALPRAHLLAATGVTIVVVAALALMPSEPASAKHKLTDVEKSDAVAVSDFDAIIQPPPVEEPVVALPSKPALTWKEITVKSGDNLSTLFKKASLSPQDVHRFVSSSKSAKQLKRLIPGQTLSFGLNQDGQLDTLRYRISQLESWQFKHQGDQFEAEHIVLEPQVTATYREAEITSSLFVAADNVGIPHDLIMELAGIFGWDVDFALDIRKGDHFMVLYEEKFLDGAKIGNGNILAAEFTNQGKTFKAVRFEDANGHANYYTPEGLSMRKAFLRTPVNFARVSSGFNMRRLHPITKKVRPHRGIDYAAPTGTPIYASGDGKVVKAGYTRANGNYVVIQHGQSYSTKYLHLHKRKVKRGQSVRQGQTIGTVGATGLATGPHLHYEFLVNGVHRNPRTVKLPQAKPIAEKHKAEFLKQTQPLIASLAKHRDQNQLAQLGKPKKNEG
ncbi:peptidoglycan DD-metalloendopeptidase family protein [bacterium SCSIO 12696]|nr:peptidoglycan DD-metalloendopeptidase family protein [bacterium SCSIO 12696]